MPVMEQPRDVVGGLLVIVRSGRHFLLIGQRARARARRSAWGRAISRDPALGALSGWVG